MEQRGISSRAIGRWTVKGGVGFIPALKREAFSSILRNPPARSSQPSATTDDRRRERLTTEQVQSAACVGTHESPGEGSYPAALIKK